MGDSVQERYAHPVSAGSLPPPGTLPAPPPPPVVPAGWYPDVTQPSTQRYWDGYQWTEHSAPLATADEETDTGLARAGYLLAIFIGILGLAMGLYMLHRKDPKGQGVVIVSLLSMFVVFLIVSAGGG